MSGRWILVLGALFALLLAVSVACGEGAQNDIMMLGGSEGSNSGSSTRSSRENADEPISAQFQISESDSFDADDDMSESAGEDGGFSTGLEFGYPPVSAQNRLIVRIVDMTIEVDDVPGRMDNVSGIAVQRGGWVVSESRSSLARRQHLCPRPKRAVGCRGPGNLRARPGGSCDLLNQPGRDRRVF